MLKQHLPKMTWALSRLFPAMLGQWAAKQIQTPAKPSQLQTQLAEPNLVWEKGAVTIRQWGKQGRVAVLLHGWEGQASQFHALAQHLLTDGYRVVIVEPQGHGASQGVRTSPAHFADALLSASEVVGSIDLFIGHSMGGLGGFIALSKGLKIPKVISISAPSEMSRSIDAVGHWLRLSKGAHASMRQAIEKFAGMTIDAIDATKLLKNYTGQLLLIQDRSDKKVTIHHAERIKSIVLGARVIYTEGLGHNKILQDPGVHQLILKYAALVRAA